MTRAMLFTLLLLGSASVQAHGLWVAQRAGALAVVYGEGAEEEAYDPARVTGIRAWKADGEPAGVRSAAEPQRMLIHAPEAAQIAIDFDAGEWTQSHQGKWMPGGRSAALPDARQTWRLMRFATVLLASPDAPARPHGMPLEIQPLADPLLLKKGQLLPVRVLQRGKPLAGAKVIADFVNDDLAAPSITDQNGIAHVALGSNGLNVIQTAHAEAYTGTCTTDRTAYSATLSFTLPRPMEQAQ